MLSTPVPISMGDEEDLAVFAHADTVRVANPRRGFDEALPVVVDDGGDRAPQEVLELSGQSARVRVIVRHVEAVAAHRYQIVRRHQ
jgi:hypothetical protein